MAFSFLKRLFGGGSKPAPAAVASAKAEPADGGAGGDVKAFVEFVARSLVDAPERVQVTIAERDRETTVQIACEKRDIGKIIGKSGKTIAAIRALANSAAGRSGKRVNVEVLD